MTLGAIPYVLISLFIFGIILIVLGTVVDAVLIQDNNLALDTTLPYSQNRADSMNWLVLCFRALGVSMVIGSCIFLTMNGIQERSGSI